MRYWSGYMQISIDLFEESGGVLIAIVVGEIQWEGKALTRKLIACCAKRGPCAACGGAAW